LHSMPHGGVGMIVELVVAFFFALILCFAIWALVGLILMPVFSENIVSFLFVGTNDGEIEGRVRTYGWLREGKCKGGQLVIVDCGMSAEGLEVVQRLRKSREWLDYCPYQALPDYIELLQHCLEINKKL